MRRGAAAIAVVLAVLAPQVAVAGEIVLNGQFVQGGMITGKIPPGSTAALDDRSLPVAADGTIAFGFSREATGPATLRVRFPDGTSATRSLTIATRSFDIQRIEGLPQAMVDPPAATLARIKADNAAVAAARRVVTPVPLFAAGWDWPVQGPISGVYGSQRILNGQPRAAHYGVDIAAPTGTPVATPLAGTVTLAQDLYFTGWTVIIDHGLGISSTYSHLATMTVAAGQAVERGTIIGTVGATGRATGPHLDWRVNWFEVRLDPALLVGPMPGQPAPAARR